MKVLSVKFLFLLLTISWSFSTAQDVKVDVNFPDFCKTGEKCVVEVVIEKGAIEGFARLQQTLPEGFRAELIDDAGSDFIFDKQRVSFIWLNLPAASVVKVSYRITVDASLAGTFNVGDGTFSYMKENRIQRLPLTPFKIDANVKAAPVVVKEPPVEKEQATQVAVADDQKEETVITQEVSETVETETSKKQEAILEEIPAGGIRIEPTVVKKEEQPVEEAVAILPDTVAKTAAIVPETVEARPVIKETVKEKSPEVVQAPAEVPVPEATTAVYYRVQFAALKQFREPESLRSQFNIQEKVYHESADGWNRYTFGQWSSMTEAEAARKAFVSRTGNNAILVKYQGSKRIQVN